MPARSTAAISLYLLPPLLLQKVFSCNLQVGHGPAQGTVQHPERWKHPGLYRRTGQGHVMVSSQAAAPRHTTDPSGNSQGLRGTIHHALPDQQAVHNSYRLAHAHISQRGGVLWGADTVQQQQPQQHEGWDYQAQDSSRQEFLAWQANERSYAENDHRQLQSAAEPVARQQYRQPSAYMPHTGRGNAYQDPLYGQPYGQPFRTPPYGAIRGMGPDQMHAHSGPYAQRVPPIHEMPILQESNLIYQEGGAYHDRPGQKRQQLGAPLQRQTYSGFGQDHDNDVQLVRSAMPAQPYMDAPCAFGEPMLQARQPMHQTTARDYPARAIHNVPVTIPPNL